MREKPKKTDEIQTFYKTMFLYYYKYLYNNIPYECNFYKYSCKNMFSVSLFSPLKNQKRNQRAFLKWTFLKMSKMKYLAQECCKKVILLEDAINPEKMIQILTA